ncbi:MAG: YlqD family protein, partial [Cyanobacteria bacterium J06633_1]
MDYSNASLLLKRPVTVKAIVTAQWKEEVTQQLQKQVAQLDKQMQQLEMQGKRTIEEITKQAGAATPQVKKQTENIQGQVNQKKAEMLERAPEARTVPQIFIGDTYVGGCDDLMALDDAGELDALLAA